MLDNIDTTVETVEVSTKPLIMEKVLMGISWFFKKIGSGIKWIVVEGYLLVKWMIKKAFALLFWVMKKISIFIKKLLVVLVIPPFLVIKITYKVMKWIILKILSGLKWLFTADKITEALSITVRVRGAINALNASDGSTSEKFKNALKALFTLSAISENSGEEVVVFSVTEEIKDQTTGFWASLFGTSLN